VTNETAAARYQLDEETGEVRPITTAVTVFGTNDPTEIVARTSVIARAIGQAIREGHMSLTIQRREYVRVEGWSYLGTMLGVYPRVREVRALSETEATQAGYIATVELVTKNGEVVGGATAVCSRGERHWKDRDDYALLSMAQTRATGKAFRLTFGFVMAAAGYESTPVEEMPIEELGAERQEPPARDPENRMGAELNEAMASLGFRTSDLAPIVGTSATGAVTQGLIMAWLGSHEGGVAALIEAVKASVAERVAAGEPA
jgi:hypothetical protein